MPTKALTHLLSKNRRITMSIPYNVKRGMVTCWPDFKLLRWWHM